MNTLMRVLIRRIGSTKIKELPLTTTLNYKSKAICMNIRGWLITRKTKKKNSLFLSFLRKTWNLNTRHLRTTQNLHDAINPVGAVSKMWLLQLQAKLLTVFGIKDLKNLIYLTGFKSAVNFQKHLKGKKKPLLKMSRRGSINLTMAEHQIRFNSANVAHNSELIILRERNKVNEFWTINRNI